MSTGSGGDQHEIRKQKLDRLKEAGIQPWPERFERTHTLAEARLLPPGTEGVRVAGRVMSLRVMGKMSFATLQDQSGRCQIAVQQEAVGESLYKEFWKKLVDIGDFLGVSGPSTVTKAGEPTITAQTLTFLGKSLRPLPEKWHGVQDREICYRQRYLDLMVNRESMDRFLLRSKVVQAIRAVLEESQFVEVETPILLTKASGAAARPFKSRHNALGMDVFLRIAPETYLKRLIVGGFDRVYEMARCFRNEGMDPTHLQDFTMLEWYAALWNYEDSMRFTQHLIQETVQRVFGTTKVEVRGETIELAGTWPRVSFRDLILKDAGIDLDQVRSADALREAIKTRRIDLQGEDVSKLGYGNLVDTLYKKVSRPALKGPLFLTEHPIDLSPLARRNDQRPDLTDRFQLVILGQEIVNAYSELVDPIDQRERLLKQAALKEGGDEEAMEMEEDYLHCMEYGMPPISGFGMGIDRLLCLLTNQDNLRDVVLFPLMKPQ